MVVMGLRGYLELRVAEMAAETPGQRGWQLQKLEWGPSWRGSLRPLERDSRGRIGRRESGSQWDQ